ncbi:molybdopterin-dependent oxidoreductase [Micromonospora sp. AMSO31t]|uniref:molybdopterin-dependent oxidoreductase n=1 Tax=Micromonospora sp. AMSO31t TaxID=2650566 RepID=UPI00351BAA94
MSRGQAALAGATAAGVAIGVAEPVAVLTGPRSAPLIAVGGLVVDVVPEPLKQFAIAVFGTHDKVALLVGTAVLLAAIAALIGVLAARRLRIGLAGIAAFAALGVAAALTRAGADAFDALPSLVGGGLGALTLWAFVAGPLGEGARPRTSPATPEPGPSGPTPSGPTPSGPTPPPAGVSSLACVSNEVGGDLIGNARWLGVPIKELLDEAQPEEGADQVVGRSVDGWTCGTPTAVLRDGRDALLAVGMNGEPLPVEHGFPVRMVVPGLYGYVSACKWVTELELTSFADFDAYWVPRGWSAQGPIRTQSRIDTPRRRNPLTAGPVTVAGVAWAQHRGIRRVEVRVDGGPWREATLAPTVSVDTWVQWSWRWDATPGDHTLQVRATDSAGQTQPEQRRPVAPDGATGWHTVPVTVG